MDLIDGDVSKRLRALAVWARDDQRTLAASAAQDGADEIDLLRGALRDLRLTARVLLENAHGCAVNHYGEDYSIHGPPGWLADCENSIATAEKMIEPK